MAVPRFLLLAFGAALVAAPALAPAAAAQDPAATVGAPPGAPRPAARLLGRPEAPVAEALPPRERRLPPEASVPPDAADAPAYYAVRAGAEVRREPSMAAPLLATLRLREGVRVLDADSAAGPWRLVQAAERRGYVASSALSNVWLRVDKSERTLYVYRGAALVRALPADVSVGEGDKIRRARLDEQDLWRVPEGTFYVTRRNDASSYYRAFVLSYPSPPHALRGVNAGLISEGEYQAIVQAHAEGREPPQGTRLGGLIEIHGSGSGRRTAWTRGCVALRNVHMDDLWEIVAIGTPVVIEP